MIGHWLCLSTTSTFEHIGLDNIDLDNPTT